MNCRQIDDYLLDYCENKLPAHLCNEIEEHLKTCPLCRNNEKWTRAENRILSKSVEIPPLAPNFDKKLMQILRSREENCATQNIPHKPVKPKKVYAVLAAAATVAAVILLLVTSPLNHPQNEQVQQAVRNSRTPGQTVIDSGTKRLPEPRTGTSSDPVTKTAQTSRQGFKSDSDTDTSRIQAQNDAIEMQDSAAGKQYEIAMVEQTGEVAPISSVFPVPSGIPAPYTMVKCTADENQAVYYYSSGPNDTSDNVAFLLTIARANADDTSLKTESRTLAAKTAVAPEIAIRTVTYGGQTYQVKMEANKFDEKEITGLLETIELTNPASESDQMLEKR